jgi:isopentenyldiphosphate isomerase
MDQVFVGEYNGTVNPNPEEVQNFRWMKWAELQQKTKDETLAPWFVYMLRDKKLILFIHSYLQKGNYESH